MDLRREIKLSDLVPKRPARTPRSQPKKLHERNRRAAGAEIVGLKIGATAVTAAQVENNGGKRVVRLARQALAPGVVDSGEVRDPIALGHALAELFRAHQLPRRGVRLGIANSRIGVRVIEVAGVEDERQLENAIAFRAHEMLSVPQEEAVLDYHVLSSQTNGDGATARKILLVVAYRDSVDRYLDAAEVAGIEVSGIDLEAFALLRAVAAPGSPVDEGVSATAVTAVNVGHERTVLAISNGEVCEFARVLQWGGSALGQAIARALKVSSAEGESLKRGLSLEHGDEGAEGLSAADAAEAVEAVRYELSTLVRELLSSLRFYQSQPDSLAIGEILLTGGTSAIPGLAAELERELGIGVRVCDPLARVQLAEGVQPPDPPGAVTVAVGLGIED
jgi:type IV pilus assembly protein PilM